MAIITHELQHTLLNTLKLKTVYFTADGNHHFRVFKCNGQLYTRLQEVPEKTKSGIVIPNKFELVPFKDPRNPKEDDPRFLVKEEMTREQVLNATPADRQKESAITKAEILGILDISSEELEAVLKTKRGKK